MTEVRNGQHAFDDESTNYWLEYTHAELAHRVAALHAQRREVAGHQIVFEVEVTRKTVAACFIRGIGVEVGAGSRPFSLPEGAACQYGDIRSLDELKLYFKSEDVRENAPIDAQSFDCLQPNSIDFIISAHVIEHLFDPLGSIVRGLQRLKSGGVYLIVVPDKRFTFDVNRPETSLNHVLDDFTDGGVGTRIDAYREHCSFVHPVFSDPLSVEQIEFEAVQLSDANFDIHVHCWTGTGFRSVIQAAQQIVPSTLRLQLLNVNENIFVISRE